MKQIEIQSIRRHDSYIELTVKMRFTLPSIYGTGSNPIVGLDSIVASYGEGYFIEVIVPEGAVIGYSQLLSLDLTATANQIKSKLENKYNVLRSRLDSLTLKPFDLLLGLSYDGVNWS